MNFVWITIPTVFTLVRLFVSPVLMPLLIGRLLPRQRWYYSLLVMIVFGGLASTDFFDGYLARRFGQESEVGRLLDPLADKILVATTCIALVALKRMPVWGAIIFIGREFFVTALREATVLYGISVPVMMSGKIKTTVQMMYLMMAIVNTRPGVSRQLNGIEWLLYGASCIFTLFSACIYCVYGLQQLALR